MKPWSLKNHSLKRENDIGNGGLTRGIELGKSNRCAQGLVMSWSDDWEGIGHVNCLSREDFVVPWT